ncbi:MAG TPA: dihydrodipicolinate synthase family protein [Pyrinomonadaceae bacterium]|nr:dihydrodipicolinate synthase family protein [Pyrinomonadaceae bacterium]
MFPASNNGLSASLPQKICGGLIPAVPVPFGNDGKFHSQAHDSYLRYMTSQPIAGVAVWAHTGRGLLLDPETAQRVLVDWRAALTGKVLIAGVGARAEAESLDQGPAKTRAVWQKRLSGCDRAKLDTIEMAAQAARLGADGLLVYPPTWLKTAEARDELIIDLHAELAQVGPPLILFYLYEAAGGISYTPAVLDELLSLPNVAGIKMATLDSVMTYQDIARQIQEKHPDKLLITGEDRFLGYSLQRGAQSALIGMGALCCELQAELLRANVEKKAARFLELSAAVDRLAETLFIDPMEGYIGRILWALSHLGIIPREAAYDPWGPALRAQEFENIVVVLEEITACVGS